MKRFVMLWLAATLGATRHHRLWWRRALHWIWKGATA